MNIKLYIRHLTFISKNTYPVIDHHLQTSSCLHNQLLDLLWASNEACSSASKEAPELPSMGSLPVKPALSMEMAFWAFVQQGAGEARYTFMRPFTVWRLALISRPRWLSQTGIAGNKYPGLSSDLRTGPYGLAFHELVSFNDRSLLV